MIADALRDTLNQYMDDVLDGTVVACQLVRAAVERHQQDLQRQSTEEFPYHFDAAHAAKVCRFYPSVLRHSIGRYAKLPFELSPWQVFCESMIFGWLRDCDNTRRFRKSYESVARKNGKSTRAAGRSLYLARYDHNPVAAAKQNKSFVPEPVSQVVLAATKKDQAEKIVYAEIERMRRASKSIRRGSNDSRRQIEFFENSGTIICVGSDKAYDGLNPHHVNLDELHAWNEYHRDFYDTMMTGSGYRDQPLISIITTAGDDKSHLWKEVYSYASDVVSGVVNDESYFAFIAELDKDDDPLDEDNWEKANPNLGVSVSLDYLRQQAIEAKQSSVNLNRFTRYHGNRMVSSIEKAFDLEKWDERGVDELSDWSEADAYGIGVDLGARDDLAARAIVARFLVEYDADTPVYRYEAKVQAYIADDCKRDLTKQPFAEWVYGGRLIKSRVPITDLTEDVVEQAVEYNAHAVAYDPYNGQAFAEALEAQGITVARCAQNCSMFNEPIQDLLQAISDGRFTHDRNPLLRWAVNNAVITKDRQGRMMYDKSKSSEKIDPTVAMTMAFRIASLAPQRATGSLYI